VKILEYLWLMAAGLLALILVLKGSTMSVTDFFIYGLSLAMASFMFYYRRKQRLNQGGPTQGSEKAPGQSGE
jgi:hypothetical protein